MAYSSYDQHDSPRRHDSYSYSSMNQNGYSHLPSSYDSYGSHYASYAAAPALPRHSPTQYSYSTTTRKRRTWPPSPSVEDEKVSLAKEVPSANAHPEDDVGNDDTRGSIDQYPIIQEIERPDLDRRFVLVSDPRADSENNAARDRRKSFAERGNMPHIKTDVDGTPLFTGRTPTPYSYTRPQKEVLTPSAEYTLSPEPATPSYASIPRTVPSRDAKDGHREKERPSRETSRHGRYDSFAQSPRTSKTDVFEDSDTEGPTPYLHAERKPARYSFVKSDLQKDDLRASLLESQGKPDPKASGRGPGSSGSSKHHTPGNESPRSSTSSLGGGYSSRGKAPPAPIERHDTYNSSYYGSQSSRPSSPRPRSPLHRDAVPSPPRSPHHVPRRSDSPSTSRPSSRSGAPRPSSPLSSSAIPPPPSPRISEADWHSTYPPVSGASRPRASSRVSRHDSLPVRGPRIDIQSPSPARPPKPQNPLPYPVDGISLDAFMPQEEKYQFDHSMREKSPKSAYPESPKLPPSPRLNSPRERPPKTQSYNDGRPPPRRTLSLDRPMPSCPRSESSAKYDDWYTLDSCPNFDVCPSCFFGVFADTEFSDYFRPVRRYGERYCDFSSPWMRLAWLLTIKQQRHTPDLLYQLATILDVEAPCPKDREVPDALWYGLPDPRDGIHVSNFSVCPCDLKMLEALCPTIRGYLTPLPYSSSRNLTQQNYICALRTTSKRFPKYLDLLVEIDEEARNTGRSPDISPFIKLAREHAFQNQCTRSKPLHRRPWHFIPSLPEFTVCEECYQDVIWPALQRKDPIARLFNYTTQLVPGEDSTGTSCCLYSPRMRRVWDRAVEKEDFGYLRRKATERKEVERRLVSGLREIEEWKRRAGAGVGGQDAERMVERLRRELVGEYEDWEAVE